MTENSQREIENRVGKLLTYLKPEIRRDMHNIPRPFTAEFLGSPDAGKTTIITEMGNFFKGQGFRVWCPQEGAEVVRHMPRESPLYNIRTTLYAMKLLIDVAHGHAYDIVFFDRCIYDAYVWMMYWRERNMLSEEEMTTIQNFVLSRFLTDKIDIAFIVTCDPEEAMKRALKNALSEKRGFTNASTIKALADRYRIAFNQLTPYHSQLRHIDTTNLTEQGMIQEVANETIQTLEKKFLIEK